jgi:hypothetical protein
MNSFDPVAPRGAWAHGDRMIAARDAVLPPYCLKCGRPAGPDFLRRQFSWHQSWIYAFLLIAVLAYAILAAILSKRMTLRLPLCAVHLQKYKALRAASAVLLLGGLAELVVAGTVLPADHMAIGITAGLLALVAGCVCLAQSNGVLRVDRMDDSFGYFSKACEGFLLRLPPSPPGMVLPR